MNLIDIGANLAHESFDTDLPAVLTRAADVGVRRIIVTGSCLDSSRRALELAQQYSGQLFATAGLHPHHAAEYGEAHRQLFHELGQLPEVVALGECGLDYFRDLAPRAAQRAAFADQLRIAVEAGKPVFLHQRDAHADFLPMLRELRGDLVNCVVHCFTDTAEALDDYLALDCHIGITGWICDERRGRDLIDSVGCIPVERLMIETDAPYLMPRTLRPRPKTRRNEPMHLPAVLTAVADARGEDIGELAQGVTATSERFFRLPA